MTNYAIWGLFGPATWAGWLTGAAIVAALRPRWRRHTGKIAALAFAAFVGLAVLPTGYWLAEPLESRFRSTPLPERIDHIVVLAGAERLAASARRGSLEVGDGAERIIDGAILAKAHPEAVLWIVGGVRDRRSARTDADWTARAWRELGLDPSRIRAVQGSFNTYENALRVAAARPSGRIVLVTSALHMPRAIGCFRAVGLRPRAYPVDYLNPSIKRLGDWFQPGLLNNLERTDRSLHEWLGLVLYRLQGRTLEFFPVP